MNVGILIITHSDIGKTIITNGYICVPEEIAFRVELLSV